MRYILILTFIFGFSAKSNEDNKKVIYEFKKYEKFDLGNLEVKGQIIAPGDLSVRQRKRKRFRRDIYKRENFRDFIYKDLIFQR